MSPLNFRWVHLSVFFIFTCLDFLLHFGENLRLVFIQTGDHKITAHKFFFQVAWNSEKEVTKKKGGGVSIWPSREGFWGKFLLELEWWYKVQ